MSDSLYFGEESADLQYFLALTREMPNSELKKRYWEAKQNGHHGVALCILVACWDRRKAIAGKKVLRKSLAELIIAAISSPCRRQVGDAIYEYNDSLNILTNVFAILDFQNRSMDILVAGNVVFDALSVLGYAVGCDTMGLQHAVSKRMFRAVLDLARVVQPKRNYEELIPLFRVATFALSTAFCADEFGYFDECVEELVSICEGGQYDRLLVESFVEVLAEQIALFRSLSQAEFEAEVLMRALFHGEPFSSLAEHNNNVTNNIKRALCRLAEIDPSLKVVIDRGIAKGRRNGETGNARTDSMSSIKSRWIRLTASHAEHNDFDFSEEEIDELKTLLRDVSSDEYEGNELDRRSLQLLFLSLMNELGIKQEHTEKREDEVFEAMCAIIESNTAGPVGLDAAISALRVYLQSVVNSADYPTKALPYMNALNRADKVKALSYGSKNKMAAAMLQYRAENDVEFYGMAALLMGRLNTTDLVERMYSSLSQRRNLSYSIDMVALANPGIRTFLWFGNRNYAADDIKGSLPRDTALIEFFFLPTSADSESPLSDVGGQRSCFAALVGEGGIRFFEIGPETEIREYLHGGEALAGGGQRRGGAVAAAMEALLSACDEAGCERLLICSEGSFNSASFAALPYKDKYVIDRFAVCNIANTYDLVCGKIEHQVEKHALVLSDPVFGKGDKAHFQTLLGGRCEGTVVGKAFSDAFGENSVTSLRRADATKSALLESLQSESHGVVHLSTHGDVDDGIPCLILAGANDGDDAKLYPYDLTREAMQRTNLVVFALCHAGEMDTDIVESMSGFVKTALLAGASSAILPLGEVDDAASVVFFKLFYEIYLSDPDRPVETVTRDAIMRMRSLTSDKVERLSKELGLRSLGNFDLRLERPLDDIRYWGPWICFAGRR